MYRHALREKVTLQHPQLPLHSNVEISQLGRDDPIYSSASVLFLNRGTKGASRDVPVSTSEMSIVSSLPRRISSERLEGRVKPPNEMGVGVYSQSISSTARTRGDEGIEN